MERMASKLQHPTTKIAIVAVIERYCARLQLALLQNVEDNLVREQAQFDLATALKPWLGAQTGVLLRISHTFFVFWLGQGICAADCASMRHAIQRLSLCRSCCPDVHHCVRSNLKGLLCGSAKGKRGTGLLTPLRCLNKKWFGFLASVLACTGNHVGKDDRVRYEKEVDLNTPGHIKPS